MTNRRKDILKRKYIAPEAYFEQTEPWVMQTASTKIDNMNGETPEGGDDPFSDLFSSKQNYIPFFNDEEYENLPNE